MNDDIKSKTKVFVCTTSCTQMSQKLFQNDSMYVPYDATHDELNHYLNEFTMICWAGSHLDQIDAEWIGMTHYRRKLDIDSIQSMDSSTIVCSLCQMKSTDFCLYSVFHNADDYARLLLQPQLTVYDKMMVIAQMDSAVMAWKNMFIMHKSKFKEYFDFMLRVRAALVSMKSQLDLDSRDFYQSRALSFLAERCTSAWILNQHSTGKARIVPAQLVEDDTIESPFQRGSTMEYKHEDSSSGNTER